MAKKPLVWWEGPWLYQVEQSYLFLMKRAARQAWKPRSSKSRWMKRGEKCHRRQLRIVQESFKKPPPPGPSFQYILFSDVPIVLDKS